MFVLAKHIEEAREIHALISDMARDPANGLCTMRAMALMAGIMVECCLNDDGDAALRLNSTSIDVARSVGVVPTHKRMDNIELPPAWLVDRDVEIGRRMATTLAARLDGGFNDVYAITLDVIQHSFIQWEEDRLPRAETLNLFIEIFTLGMSLEIGAQEICGMSLELKVFEGEWTIPDTVSALSGLAGYQLALHLLSYIRISMIEKMDLFEEINHVMTREAHRYGVPAGPDWRFGVAANDSALNAPQELVESLLPACINFLHKIDVSCPLYQSTICAKAAGRMLAVVCGDERGQLQPVIAKPMAFASMSETFKSVLLSDRNRSYN